MDAIPNFGAKKKPTRSSGIAAQKIATMTKGSDKLAKAAEEQAAKVSRICKLKYCRWRKNYRLPVH